MLVSLATGVSTAVVLQQTEAKEDKVEDPTPVLRVQRLEVVDKNGDTCVVLGASEGGLGGFLQIRRPSLSAGSEGILCYIGSVFENFVQLTLKAPAGVQHVSPESESRISLSISGSWSTPSIDFVGSDGKQIFCVSDYGPPEAPIFRLWRTGENDPFFKQ